MEKIGMFWGKFMPLHKGHLYCIDVDSKEFDWVYAILFRIGSDEEEILRLNPEDKTLLLDNRFNCLKEVCKYYDNVIPILILGV